MNPSEIELFPGEKELSKPLFNSREEYQKWLDSSYEQVKLGAEENRIRQMRSIQESLTRIVN